MNKRRIRMNKRARIIAIAASALAVVAVVAPRPLFRAGQGLEDAPERARVRAVLPRQGRLRSGPRPRRQAAHRQRGRSRRPRPSRQSRAGEIRRRRGQGTADAQAAATGEKAIAQSLATLGQKLKSPAGRRRFATAAVPRSRAPPRKPRQMPRPSGKPRPTRKPPARRPRPTNSRRRAATFRTR